MTRADILQRIDDAKFALEEYKRRGLDKSRIAAELIEIQEIRKATIELVVETRISGAFGPNCPICNGNSRISGTCDETGRQGPGKMRPLRDISER